MKICSLLLLLSLGGCSLFSVKDYRIVNQDAKQVALYNLSVLKYCQSGTHNYLYVNSDLTTTGRNLFVYINDLNQDLARSHLCLETLKTYNTSIIEEIENKHA